MQIRTKQISDLLTTCVPITGSTLDVDLNGKILSNLLTPLLIGGTAVGSTLTYKTTTGIGTTDAHIFQVGNNGATEAMRILNSGNVGIGTITPLGILHLYKSAATTRMVMDGDAGQSKIITYRSGGLQRFGLYVNNTAESGSNVGSDFQIRAYNDAGTLLSTPFFIKRSTGNVGIGTTAPVSKITTADDVNFNPTFTFLDNRNLNAAGWLANTTPLGTIQAYTTDPSTTPNPIGAITFIAPQISVSSPACDISFSTGNSGTFAERMRILSTGNVGIGTIAPSEKFHLLDSRTTAGSAGIYLQKTGVIAGTSYGSYTETTGASTTNIGGYFTASGATNNYAIIVPSTGGNVGIGQTTPTAVLHLKGGSASSSSAPLKFSSGALNITPEVGAIEFLTDAYYATITTGAARKTFAFLESNAVNNRGINVTFDGQGIIIPLNTNSIIAAAATNGTITEWFIEGDVSGSIVVDILKNGVSMSGAGNKPTLASALTANAAVSGWTSLSFATNDKLEIKVTTASTTLTKCYLTIKYNIL